VNERDGKNIGVNKEGDSIITKLFLKSKSSVGRAFEE